LVKEHRFGVDAHIVWVDEALVALRNGVVTKRLDRVCTRGFSDCVRRCFFETTRMGEDVMKRLDPCAKRRAVGIGNQSADS